MLPIIFTCLLAQIESLKMNNIHFNGKSYFSRFRQTQTHNEAGCSDVNAATKRSDSAPVGQQARRKVGQGHFQ